MTKLTKTDIAARDEIANRLQDKYTAVMDAVEAYNNAASDLWEAIQVAVYDYNSAIADANSWKAERAQEMQDALDGHSGKWQESDKGLALQSWKEQYEEELEDIEIEQPESVSDGIEDYTQILWDLPEGTE